MRIKNNTESNHTLFNGRVIPGGKTVLIPDAEWATLKEADVTKAWLLDGRLEEVDADPVTPSDPVQNFGGSIVKGGRPAVINITTNLIPTRSAHSNAIVQINASTARTVTLPNDWLAGEGFAVRRMGTGTVAWSGTTQLPAGRASHTQIAERYGEVYFRCVEPGVWDVQGATA